MLQFLTLSKTLETLNSFTCKMDQSSNAKGGEQRQITVQELQVVIGIAEHRIEDRYNIFYLQLSQALRHNLRRMRQALAEPLGVDTEPQVLLAEYMESEHRAVEAWNLHRLNGVVRYIPEEDVPDTLHNFPLRGAAHDLSTYRGYQFQMPTRPLPRSINGIDEHDVLTAHDFLEQPDMQSIVRLGVLTLENIENPSAPVVPEEQPDLMPITEFETVPEGFANEPAGEIDYVHSAIEQVGSISTAVPLEESVFETGNEILEGIQEVADLDPKTIDKMLMEDLEKGHRSLAKQAYSDVQQDTTVTAPEPEEGTHKSRPNLKLVDVHGTQNQSALDKKQDYANCESDYVTVSSSSQIESSASDAKMPTRIDAYGTVRKTEEEDGDMTDQDIKDEDADMADVEDNCDANSEDQNEDAETSDGREPSDIKSESEDIATPTQSEGDQIDGMSSDGEDDSFETPKELEFEDDAVRLEQLEQSYLWGETTEEETDGSDGDYIPDENSEDEEEGPPVKKRRL